jgi:hypothetical protein
VGIGVIIRPGGSLTSSVWFMASNVFGLRFKTAFWMMGRRDGNTLTLIRNKMIQRRIAMAVFAFGFPLFAAI